MNGDPFVCVEDIGIFTQDDCHKNQPLIPKHQFIEVQGLNLFVYKMHYFPNFSVKKLRMHIIHEN